MGIKAQYNSSTGKASYTVGTGKQQVFNTDVPGHECTGCINPPAQIELIMSGLTAVCCGISEEFDFAYSWTSNCESLLNDTFILEQTGATIGCAWEKTIIVPATTYGWSWYSDTLVCEEVTGTYYAYSFTWTYSVSASGAAKVSLKCWINGGPNIVQEWSFATTDDTCLPNGSLVELYDCDDSFTAPSIYLLTPMTEGSAVIQLP